MALALSSLIKGTTIPRDPALQKALFEVPHENLEQAKAIAGKAHTNTADAVERALKERRRIARDGRGVDCFTIRDHLDSCDRNRSKFTREITRAKKTLREIVRLVFPLRGEIKEVREYIDTQTKNAAKLGADAARDALYAVWTSLEELSETSCKTAN